MAWTCSAASNAALVDNLVRKRLLTTARAEAAMRVVDRRLFVPPAADAYADSPQPLSCRATISAPHMHAMALQYLEPYLPPGATALDVGAGSGYFAALLAVLVGPTGSVVGVEHAAQLTDFAVANLQAFRDAAPPAAPVLMRTADGRAGASDKAPFSAIHVGAASPSIPQPLLNQLANNGAMIIPVGSEYGPQNLMLVNKDQHGHVTSTSVCGVRYVPLCDLDHQLH
ncbi:unnamed protein product [Agarophyton chilense]